MTADDTGNDPVTFLSHAQMQQYQASGQVEPLSRVITDFVKYGGRWWIADRQGWHLVDDAYLIAKLDNHASWAGGSLYASGRQPADDESARYSTIARSGSASASRSSLTRRVRGT